jgi:hypothetical protein
MFENRAMKKTYNVLVELRDGSTFVDTAVYSYKLSNAHVMSLLERRYHNQNLDWQSITLTFEGRHLMNSVWFKAQKSSK